MKALCFGLVEDRLQGREYEREREMGEREMGERDGRER